LTGVGYRRRQSLGGYLGGESVAEVLARLLKGTTWAHVFAPTLVYGQAEG